MGLGRIIKGLSEDIDTLKKARKTGQLKRECERAKKYGTYKEKIIACGISRLLSNKNKKKSKKTRKYKRRY